MDLNSNQLSTLQIDSFIKVKDLNSLFLENNNIIHLPEGVFSSMNKCSELSLKSNQISVIQTGLFKGLTQLHFLSLDQNEISLLEGNTFMKLSHLLSLSLTHNQLTFIQNNTFTGLENLSELYLSFNYISIISPSAFVTLGSLNILTLFSNKLTTLDFQMFTFVARPLSLALSDPTSDNDAPWDCQSLCWIKQEEAEGKIKWCSVSNHSACYHSAGPLSKPKCMQGDWDQLNCSKTGEFRVSHRVSLFFISVANSFSEENVIFSHVLQPKLQISLHGIKSHPTKVFAKYSQQHFVNPYPLNFR